MYRDTCISDTSIDLTAPQSIVDQYRLTLFSSIVYRLTQKLSIAPISGYELGLAFKNSLYTWYSLIPVQLTLNITNFRGLQKKFVISRGCYIEGMPKAIPVAKEIGTSKLVRYIV